MRRCDRRESLRLRPQGTNASGGRQSATLAERVIAYVETNRPAPASRTIASAFPVRVARYAYFDEVRVGARQTRRALRSLECRRERLGLDGLAGQRRPVVLVRSHELSGARQDAAEGTLGDGGTPSARHVARQGLSDIVPSRVEARGAW